MKLFFLLSVALTLAAASTTAVIVDTTTAVVVADTTTAVVVADTTTAVVVADTTTPAMAPDLVCNATTFAEGQVGCFRVYSAVTENATLDTCSPASFNTSTM